MSTIVGLDIGATGIRIVEATAGRDPHVRRAAAAPLPPGIVTGGVIKDPALAGQALKALARKTRLGTRKVAAVIGADPTVVIRKAEVPHLADPDDMRGAVHAQAADVLPVDVDRQYLDHHIVAVKEKVQEDNTRTQVASVAIVAAERGAVDALVETVELAGLSPVSIDISAFLLTRLVAKATSGPGRLDVIAHLGADTVTVMGVTGGQPLFQRSLNDYSAAKITTAIADHLGCPEDVAEKLKITSASLTGPEAGPTHEVVHVWTTAIVNQIKDMVLDASRETGIPLGRLWLSGGGAHLDSLGPQLKAQLGATGSGGTVAILDPATWVSKPARLVTAREATGQDFTIALAAATQ